MQKEHVNRSLVVDRGEAPAGFYAVSKDEAKPKDGSNICRACDWRSACNDRATDLLAPGHRCMSYPVVTPEGRLVQRRDGCSVLFKRWHPDTPESRSSKA